MCVVFSLSKVPHVYIGMKWLKEKAAFREEQLGELRKHAYDHFSNVLERQSHDCYITARIEFGTVTRTVCTPSYSFQLRCIFLATLF